MYRLKMFRSAVVAVTILSFTAALAYPAGLPQETRTATPGTDIKVRLTEEVGSHRNQVGDTVHARLAEPMVSNGAVVFPAGVQVLGSVIDVTPVGRMSRNGEIEFVFIRIFTDDGRQYSIVANLRGASRYTRDGVARNLYRIGIALGAGALIGLILGGRSGMLRGILLGGAAGTGYILYKEGEDVILPAGTTIDLVLEETVSVEYGFPGEVEEEVEEEEEPWPDEVVEAEGEGEEPSFYFGAVLVGPNVEVFLAAGGKLNGVFNGITEEREIVLGVIYGSLEVPLADSQTIVFEAGPSSEPPVVDEDSICIGGEQWLSGEFLGIDDEEFVLETDYGTLRVPLNDTLCIAFRNR